MALIKAHNANTLLKAAIVLDMGDVSRQAEQVKASAKARADQILAEARSEAAKLTGAGHGQGLEQGRADGLKQGLEQGRKQGREEALKATQAQLQQLQQAWLAAATEWNAQRAAMEREARAAVLELAVRLGQKVTQRIVQTDPSVVVDQIIAAVGHILKPADLTVRIHPEDRPVVEAALPRLTADLPKLEHVRLVDDPAVGLGGCVIAYGRGRVDATIDTQLARVAELLVPEMAEDAGHNAPLPRGEGG